MTTTTTTTAAMMTTNQNQNGCRRQDLDDVELRDGAVLGDLNPSLMDAMNADRIRTNSSSSSSIAYDIEQLKFGRQRKERKI